MLTTKELYENYIKPGYAVWRITFFQQAERLYKNKEETDKHDLT
jgi:hypothetical protein